jgi:hypothetical protein
MIREGLDLTNSSTASKLPSPCRFFTVRLFEIVLRF